MKLKLKRPLVFIDLETTGLNISSDRIIEIGIVKVFPDTHEEKYCYRVNPEMEISKDAIEVHGITNEDLVNAPTFKEIAPRIIELLSDADLGGFNSNKFDLPLLAEELIRCGIDFDLKQQKFIDVQTIFHKMEKRTLSAAYQFYCDKDLENAHNAEADAIATYEVLQAQLEKYDELENDVDFLSDYSSFNNNADYVGRIIYNSKQQEVINFGKYKGQQVEEVLRKDPSYYDWMSKGDFPRYTIKVLEKVLKRIKEDPTPVELVASSKPKPKPRPVKKEEPTNFSLEDLKSKFNQKL